MNQSKDQLWPGWETVRLIGRGGFGAVYEIQRTMFNDTEQAALKVITVPQNESDIEEMYSEGYDEETITSTFQTYLENIVAEYSLMRKLNGNSNIVNCDDFRYVQHDDGIGWDIFIKMELLTALPKVLPAQVPEDMVLKIARDMCAALDLCSEHKIIHRDIKPQNIFVSKHGDYKLGDFGIAKTVEKTMGGTKIGTYKYMAPEVYNNQPYGTTADIYSLGLVLYWLLNEKRMPFLPLPPAKLRVGAEEEARNRRLSGETLPEPAHGPDWLKRIVLKACAYDPRDRYQTAREMRLDLMAEGRTTVPVTAAPADTFAVPTAPDREEATALLDERTALLVDDSADEQTALLVDDPADEQTALLVEEAADEQTALLVEESADEQTALLVDDPADEQTALLADDSADEQTALLADDSADEQTALLTEEPVKPEPVYQPKPAAPKAAFCMKCGARNTGDTRFCTNCGAPLDAAPAQSQSILTNQAIQDQTVRPEKPKPPAPTPKAEEPKAKEKPVAVPPKEKKPRKRWPIFVIAGAALALIALIVGLCIPKVEYIVVEPARQTIYPAGTVLDSSDLEVYAVYSNDSVKRLSDGFQIHNNKLTTFGSQEVTVTYKDFTDSCFFGVVATAPTQSDALTLTTGEAHTVGVLESGRVIATGYNKYGQCDVDNWTGITMVSAGVRHTVGLKDDGAVVAAGDNYYSQCEVGGWTNIVAVSAGSWHTVGLRSDGTVVATGNNDYGQCNVKGWKDIVAVSAGNAHTVGLKVDGTVIATGSNEFGQCNVGGWTDIVAISTNHAHTVGLKADGTVVAAGLNDFSQCAVSDWRDIVAISAGVHHTVGLKADGTVVAAGSNDSSQCNVYLWHNVVAISASNKHTVALCADGQAVATGSNEEYRCNVGAWSNIKVD